MTRRTAPKTRSRVRAGSASHRRPGDQADRRPGNRPGPRHSPPKNRGSKRKAWTAGAVATAIAAAIALLVAAPAQAWTAPGPTEFGGAFADAAGTGPDLTDIVRALPEHDAAPGSDYQTSGTGAAPALQHEPAQPAAGIQIMLPIKTEATQANPGKQYATWQPGDQLTVSLPAGVTFAAAPTVAVSELSDLASAATLAGHAADGASDLDAVTATLQTDGGGSVSLRRPAVTVALADGNSKAVLTVTNNQWGYGKSDPGYGVRWLNLQSATMINAQTESTATRPGYVIALGNVTLDVADTAHGGAIAATVTGTNTNGLDPESGFPRIPAVAPVACTVGTLGSTKNISYVGGATTIGWLSPVDIGIAPTNLTPTQDPQPLPALTFTEHDTDGFIAGAEYTVSATALGSSGNTLGPVLFDFPAHSPAIGYEDAQASGSPTLAAGNFAPVLSWDGSGVTTDVRFTVTAADTTAIESLTVTGLRVAGYTYIDGDGSHTAAFPPGAGVEVHLTVPVRSGLKTPVNDASTVDCLSRPGASTISHSPAGPATYQPAATLPVLKSANRIAGADRYDTAARIAAALLPANAVVLANGENPKQGFDALSANFLAGRLATANPANPANPENPGGQTDNGAEDGATKPAPILLTKAGELPNATARAIRAALKGAQHPTIYLMGQPDSISETVAAQAKSIAATVAAPGSEPVIIRLAGSDRYGTSTEAARTGAAIESPSAVSIGAGQPARKTAILASGELNADALAAGPLSAALGLPVLLTRATALPASVTRAITDLGITQLIVLGGPDRISPQVLAHAQAAGVKSIKRIAGNDRYATSADLYGFARASAAARGGGLSWSAGSGVYLANGLTGFPDALAVGPLAASKGAPLLTVPAGALPPPVAAFLVANSAGIAAATALGQPATIADSVLLAANGLLG